MTGVCMYASVFCRGLPCRLQAWVLSEGDKRDSKSCEAQPHGEAQATLLRSQRPGLGPEEPDPALETICPSSQQRGESKEARGESLEESEGRIVYAWGWAGRVSRRRVSEALRSLVSRPLA